MPKASVVIPSYNHARFLRKRIESILGQTFQDFELILLDDCSTDESQSILLEYAGDPRVRVELNKANSGGPFKQWNKGVRLARGEYIWMAESDDYADARFLERLVAVLDREPEAGFVYCRSCRVDEHGRVEGFGDWYLDLVDPQRWKADFCVEGREQFARYFSRCCVVPNASAALFRKTAYERVGGADETYRVCADWKVWAAMSLAGKVAFVGEPLNYYRIHQASVLHQNSRKGVTVLESLGVVRWILDQVTFPPAVLDEVCQSQAESWVPAILSLRFPLRLKSAIWQHVRAVDPHPMRRVMRPALRSLRRKLVRHWRAVRSAGRASEAC